jgi:PTH1 family peptidyl-tRNA hydrolase
VIKLIVGLGNPGLQYEQTRHNAGFLFLDAFVAQNGGAWSVEAKFDGVLAESHIGMQKVALLKPLTFMNKSGLAVGKILRYFKFMPDELLVVHDELDLEAGVIRLKKGGGHAGHNGLRDIISHLGTKEFYRLRLGIGRPSAAANVADFVLSSPSKQESVQLVQAIDLGMQYMAKIVAGDLASVMNELHTK